MVGKIASVNLVSMIDAVAATIVSHGYLNHEYFIPYSRKYWRELNLTVGSQIAISYVLADLNLAVWYRIAICIYGSKKFWRILIWWLLRQSTKPPNLIPHQIFRLFCAINFCVE